MSTNPDLTSEQIQLLAQVSGTYQSLAKELKQRIVGQDEIVRDLFVALMVGGICFGVWKARNLRNADSAETREMQASAGRVA